MAEDAPTPLTPEQQRLVASTVHVVDVVANTLRRTYGSRLDFDEMKALGREGLVRAALTFVADKGLSFAAFAWCRIHGAMLDAIRRDQRRGKVNAALRRALDDFAEAPRDAGDYSDTDQEVDAHIDAALCHAMDSAVVSLSVQAAESAEEAFVEMELHKAVKEAVDVLPDAFRDLVRLRYIEGREMDEVARTLRVGGATVRRRQAEAMTRIRAQLAAAGLV
ncbi:MAG: sigma-70 family RNA polymerase sigma factor [Polyangiaceae bacterium]